MDILHLRDLQLPGSRVPVGIRDRKQRKDSLRVAGEVPGKRDSSGAPLDTLNLNLYINEVIKKFEVEKCIPLK